MIGYMFNPDYQEAKAQYNNANSQYKILKKINTDLSDDTSSVDLINKRIGYIYEDFAYVILDSDVQIRVNTKLNLLKEPSQTSDTILSSARSEIDDEMRHWERKMDGAEATMDRIKNQ